VEWRRLSGDDAATLTALRKAYATAGFPGLYRARLDLLLERADDSRVQPTDIASLYAALGEKDKAIRWLEKSVEQHEGEVVWLATQPDYESLRDEPRFVSLLKRVNLTQRPPA
jgi:hypothetical protein